MWIYEKKLEYPVRISKPDLKMAKLLLAQYGGQYGELSTALQYLNQRYSMVSDKVKALLTDIGTEELAHLEIIAAIIYKLIKDATPEEMEKAGLGGWYALQGKALSYEDPKGVPWSAGYIGASGDPLADLYEDIAAEERARATYEFLINLSDDPDLSDALQFLREREVLHSQRFREAVELLKEEMNS